MSGTIVTLEKKLLIVELGKIDKIENMLCRINQSSIPRHTNTVVIICGTNNLDRDKPSDITNGLICAVAVLQLKHE